MFSLLLLCCISLVNFLLGNNVCNWEGGESNSEGQVGIASETCLYFTALNANATVSETETILGIFLQFPTAITQGSTGRSFFKKCVKVTLIIRSHFHYLN